MISSKFKLKDIIFSYICHNIKINSRFSSFLFIVKLYVHCMCLSRAHPCLNLREDLCILNLISVPQKSCLTNARYGDHLHDSIPYLTLGLVAMVATTVVVVDVVGVEMGEVWSSTPMLASIPFVN